MLFTQVGKLCSCSRLGQQGDCYRIRRQLPEFGHSAGNVPICRVCTVAKVQHFCDLLFERGVQLQTSKMVKVVEKQGRDRRAPVSFNYRSANGSQRVDLKSK